MCAAKFFQLGNFQGEKASEERIGQTESTKLTGCSTYCASKNKVSSQGQRMKLKVCMYLVHHLYYVCGNYNPNRTKRASEE